MARIINFLPGGGPLGEVKQREEELGKRGRREGGSRGTKPQTPLP